ncbi:MAG: aminodeoxychorismate/anthranilate synthase component II [Lachnospiraceae bacterium]|nr:aminodeoxychorismate/anthranilate synthase component II [Lachnospiraceae bacterium]
MILLIDKYDSFSFNLYQMAGEIEPDIKVVRNDELTVEQIRELAPDKIILSPGPGRPEDAGIIVEAVRELGQDIPILGVCLGHQAICQAYGGVITYAKQLMHGKQSTIYLQKVNGRISPLFAVCATALEVARYHSLAADPEQMPDCLAVSAVTADGEIMAVQHREYPVYGVQFHPESILTPHGHRILENFIRRIHK